MTMHPNQPMALSVQQLGAQLGGVPVLQDLSFGLRAGSWVSVVGPNGAGKSSLLRALAGLLVHTGAVDLLGRPLGSYPGRERARLLSWLGQGETSDEDLYVYDLVMLGRLPHQAWLAGPAPADHAAVARALVLTKAWDWRARSIGQLSAGERQRVLLARALAVEAPVLLMDEPLANLDPPHQADWLLMVRALVAEGKTVVSVLHEISLALQADEMLVLRQGRLLHQGACSDGETHSWIEQVFDLRLRVASLDGQWLALPCLETPVVKAV